MTFERKDFARRAPKGPYANELRRALRSHIQQVAPRVLMTELAVEFEKHGYVLCFTPPYMCTFQAAELLWRKGKGDAARGWWKGRSLEQTYDDLCTGWYGGTVGKTGSVQCKEVTGVQCKSWMEECEKEMNEWIVAKKDRGSRVSGKVGELVVQSDDEYGADSDLDASDESDDELAEDSDPPSEEEHDGQ